MTTDDQSTQLDNRGEGFAQIIHDRSRDAAQTLHKMLTTLATAALGVYFVSLTRSIQPELTPIQKGTAAIALITMALAAGAGLFGMYADSRRNYHWAKGMQLHEGKEKRPQYKQQVIWNRRKKAMASTLGLSFATGIVASLAYLMERIFSL